MQLGKYQDQQLDLCHYDAVQHKFKKNKKEKIEALNPCCSWLHTALSFLARAQHSLSSLFAKP